MLECYVIAIGATEGIRFKERVIVPRTGGCLRSKNNRCGSGIWLRWKNCKLFPKYTIDISDLSVSVKNTAKTQAIDTDASPHAPTAGVLYSNRDIAARSRCDLRNMGINKAGDVLKVEV